MGNVTWICNPKLQDSDAGAPRFEVLRIGHDDILVLSIERRFTVQPKVRSNEQKMSLNDLEFAYSPVRNQVRDLREYL